MKIFLFLLIIFPFLAAIACYLVRNNTIRNLVILISGAMLIVCSLALIPLVPFNLSPESVFGIRIREILNAFGLTTVCSFLLIAHDQTEKTVKNAVRALWMNSLWGAVFITAVEEKTHENL